MESAGAAGVVLDPRASSYDPRASYADSCRRASTRLGGVAPLVPPAVDRRGGAAAGPAARPAARPPPDAPPAGPPGPPPDAPPPAEPAGGLRAVGWYYMDHENQRPRVVLGPLAPLRRGLGPRRLVRVDGVDGHRVAAARPGAPRAQFGAIRRNSAHFALRRRRPPAQAPSVRARRRQRGRRRRAAAAARLGARAAAGADGRTDGARGLQRRRRRAAAAARVGPAARRPTRAARAPATPHPAGRRASSSSTSRRRRQSSGSRARRAPTAVT